MPQWTKGKGGRYHEFLKKLKEEDAKNGTNKYQEHLEKRAKTKEQKQQEQEWQQLKKDMINAQLDKWASGWNNALAVQLGKALQGDTPAFKAFNEVMENVYKTDAFNVDSNEEMVQAIINLANNLPD